MPPKSSKRKYLFYSIHLCGACSLSALETHTEIKASKEKRKLTYLRLMDWLNNYCWIETFSKKHLCETYLLLYGSGLLFVSLLNSTHRTVLLENLFIVTSGTTCSFFSPSMFYVTEGVNMKKGSICFFI